MQNVRKGLLSVMLALLTLIGALAGMNIATSRNVSAAEDYHLWRQMDPRWGSVAIGGSTLARSGCLVTSIAILAVHSGERDPETFNPGVFANEMSALGGFTSGGAIASWATITKVLPDVRVVSDTYFKSTDKAGKAAEIKAVMDQGNYVIVNVNWHWVFIEGVVGDDVYMIDPAKDDVLLFDAYDNSGIVEYEIYTGKNPPPAFVPPTGETTEPATEEPTVIADPVAGEYFCQESGEAAVYTAADETSEVMAVLGSGQIVNVVDIADGYGRVKINGAPGWVMLSELSYAGDELELEQGDINGDGAVDRYDLALLNEYIKSLTTLPLGVSILRGCEIAAADINGDGAVNSADIIGYLELVC